MNRHQRFWQHLWFSHCYSWLMFIIHRLKACQKISCTSVIIKQKAAMARETSLLNNVITMIASMKEQRFHSTNTTLGCSDLNTTPGRLDPTRDRGPLRSYTILRFLSCAVLCRSYTTMFPHKMLPIQTPNFKSFSNARKQPLLNTATLQDFGPLIRLCRQTGSCKMSEARRKHHA